MKKRSILSAFLCCLFVIGCTSSGSDGGDSGGGGDEPAGEGEFQTDCGVVMNYEVVNPVAEKDGKKGVIKSVADANSMIVSLSDGDVLVKLQGISGAPYGLRNAAITYVEQQAAGQVTFYPASDQCSESVNGGLATPGQIITARGTSLSEDLIRKGYVQSIEPYGACGADLIAACYESLKETAPSVLGTINDFLWKPQSDGGISPGKLVVLVSACNADIVVNGEHLKYDGPSSGRCSLGRSTKTGCDYGGNVRVEVFDRNGRGVYAFPDGKLYYTVNNGCSRQEFKN